MVKSNDTAHILVIRLSAMGDVAMTVPVLSALQQEYPNLKITLLTRKAFKPLFAKLKYVEVYEADVKEKHKGLRGMIRLFNELKTLQIDIVADLHNVLRSNILKRLFSLKGTPFYQLDKGRAEKKALTRANNKAFKKLKSTHHRYAEVFSDLGFAIDLEKTVLLPREHLSDKISKYVGNKPQKWIGIAPFAAHEGKMYPIDLMQEVIKELGKQNVKIILFGGGTKEEALLDAIALKQKDIAVNITNKFSFEEELALISNLDVMVSMDSGNGHLAANYGIPVVTIWGVTHPFAGFAPFRQPEANGLFADRAKYPLIPTSVYGNKMPKGYEKVMESISPKQVVEKVIEVLNS